MKSVTQRITDPLGLHARLASKISNTASSYQSSVCIVFGGNSAQADDLLGLMALDIREDDLVHIEAEGPDEDAACVAVARVAGMSA
jgi:phosphotransferase system HPr (HPr) family protein